MIDVSVVARAAVISVADVSIGGGGRIGKVRRSHFPTDMDNLARRDGSADQLKDRACVYLTENLGEMARRPTQFSGEAGTFVAVAGCEGNRLL